MKLGPILGYAYTPPTEEIPYVCACCGVAVPPFRQRRNIPDELCTRCYDSYETQKQEPWLLFLFRQEKARRMRMWRRRNGRTDSIPMISYEECRQQEFQAI